jgi:hypothetical protein
MLGSIRDLVAQRDALWSQVDVERVRRVALQRELNQARQQIQGMRESNAKLACRLMGHDPETEHDHV